MESYNYRLFICCCWNECSSYLLAFNMSFTYRAALPKKNLENKHKTTTFDSFI